MKKNSEISKLICLFLAVLLLGSTAVACGPDVNVPPSTGESREDTTTPAEPPVVLTVAENGESSCRIYYAASLRQNPSLMTAIENLSNMISRYTGVTLELDTDRYYDGTDPGTAILIGATRHPESQEIAENLKTRDYFVGVNGNKVLVCGTSPDSVSNAIQYFINKVIVEQGKSGKTLKLSSEDNFVSHYSYGLNSIQCLGTELKNYNIVIPKQATVNESLFANNLRYYLFSEYGFDLGVTTDDKSNGEHEILIGKTSRTTAETGTQEYTVSAANGKLQLVADGMLGYDAMLSYIKETLMPSGNGKANDCVITERNSTVKLADVLESPASYALEKSGDVRVFFYNVFGYSLESLRGTTAAKEELQLKIQLQIEMFRSYEVDVLALQEFSPGVQNSTYRYGALLKNAGYTEVAVQTSGNNNYTPLFYNADRLEVLSSGYRLFAEAYNNDDSKSVTWAVFQLKGKEKKFIVMSTHFCWFAGTEGTTGRTAHAKELMNEIGKIQSQYPQYANLPVILGGDLNCTPSSAPIKVFTDAGMTSAWQLAGEKTDQTSHQGYPIYNSDFGMYTSYGKGTGKYSAAIDQAWVCGSGMTVNTYAIITDYYALISSDHCPQMVDITIS